MELSISRAITAIGLLALVAGCSGSSTSATSSLASLPTTPTTTPTAATVTETYTGNLNANGAASYAFVAQPGTITATLTAIGDGSVAVGLALGNWTGTSCVLAIASDSTLAGGSVVGSTTATANVCVRIYDVGNVTATIPYTISVVHP
jgi:hypothetical protein